MLLIGYLFVYPSCDQCEKSFTDKGSLQIHLKTHRQDYQTYPCTQCSKTYTAESSLKNHLKSHENLREWKCSHCGKGFNNKQVIWIIHNYPCFHL